MTELRFRANLFSLSLAAALVFVGGPLQGGQSIDSLEAERRIGERLFAEGRFAQADAAGLRANSSATPTTAANLVSCKTCHFPSQPPGEGNGEKRSTRAFCDFAERSPVPERGDGRKTTPRNSPTLVDVTNAPRVAPLLHYDGEFATADELVRATFTGRNFGWLPGEQAEARQHFARVIRGDDGSAPIASDQGRLSYAVLFRGTDAVIPAALRLSQSFRLDVGRATDDEIIDTCARLVVAFMRSLQFSRDAEGRHNGSPYDAFLTENRLPRAPAPSETPHEYARRLGTAIAVLPAPRFVDEPTRRLRLHDQPFRFGELELEGMRIFFRSAVGAGRTSGAGNCAECHVPPYFSDFAFHNTGVAQDDYDAQHGTGAFARLDVPNLATRAADYDRWLQPTSKHPRAKGVFLSPTEHASPGRTDLGLWNVYGNPDLPAPQFALDRLLNQDGHLSRDEVLALTLARFKTPTVRDLGQSAPYLHTGRARTVEEVISVYRRASALAREGKLRNAPPEFFGLRLEAADVAPLAAFLRALNEDYEYPRASPRPP